jgi:hypothetical protein
MTSLHPKVVAGGLAGIIVTVLVSVLSMVGVSVPTEVIAAATTLIGFIASYLQPAPKVA